MVPQIIEAPALLEMNASCTNKWRHHVDSQGVRLYRQYLLLSLFVSPCTRIDSIIHPYLFGIVSRQKIVFRLFFLLCC